MKKMNDILASNEKLRENVDMMVASGFNKYYSFCECYILMNETKIDQMSKELMKQGIPLYQARCIAEDKIFDTPTGIKI